MSNAYSLGGYKIALCARSAKTLLVEGKDDKELFDCLRLSMGKEELFVVDTQEMIQDVSLSGLGAKARIDAFIQDVQSNWSITRKLTCFVDREWEELIEPTNLDAIPWTEPLVTNLRLKTSGHSIENYGFTVDFVATYLQHFGQGVATRDLLERTSAAVPEILKAGAAFSQVARKRSLIGKCTNILELSDIEWIDGRISVSIDVEEKLTSRGAQNAVGFCQEYNCALNDYWDRLPFSKEAYLHAHGHIGELMLWLGVGKVVSDHGGLRSGIGQEIATGRRDEKRRVWHSWLAKQEQGSADPLSRVFR